jgi:hypothetical protein
VRGAEALAPRAQVKKYLATRDQEFNLQDEMLASTRGVEADEIDRLKAWFPSLQVPPRALTPHTACRITCRILKRREYI